MNLLNLTEILLKKKKLCPEYLCAIETLIYFINNFLTINFNNKKN